MSERPDITLTDDQYARLLDESERTGIDVSDLVGRAIDRAYRPPPTGNLREALEQSFGSWKDRDFDGETYVERLRNGASGRIPD